MAPSLLERAYRGLAQDYDAQHSGFGGAPKFPQAMALDSMLRYWARTRTELALTIAGDSGLQPLSRGLAELMATDLAMVRSLRLLERIQVGALLDEMKLGASGRADPTTAARVGRLLRAERMVQGVATITENGPVRMSS